MADVSTVVCSRPEHGGCEYNVCWLVSGSDALRSTPAGPGVGVAYHRPDYPLEQHRLPARLPGAGRDTCVTPRT
eukprot:8381882-Pyramimonas_sp.AAC.1